MRPAYWPDYRRCNTHTMCNFPAWLTIFTSATTNQHLFQCGSLLPFTTLASLASPRLLINTPATFQTLPLQKNAKPAMQI